MNKMFTVNSKIEYERYNPENRAFEIRIGEVNHIREYGNTVQTFITDVHDEKENVINIRNGKITSIGVRFA